MPILDFPADDIKETNQGLAYLGWSTNNRLTSDDFLILRSIAAKAKKEYQSPTVDVNSIEQLAIEAYDILRDSLTSPAKRAYNISRYQNSPHLSQCIPLIDEATLAFYRGYDTTALSALFIALEMYLRSAVGWTPGGADVNFATLRNHATTFRESRAKHIAVDMLNKLYARYDALRPPTFYYNRHGLLHGMRQPIKEDEMNCARTLFLLDVLAEAENPDRSGAVVITDEFRERQDVYTECNTVMNELRFLHRL